MNCQAPVGFTSIPFGQRPPQGSHLLTPFFSTSILSDGQLLTHELPSTTKFAEKKKPKMAHISDLNNRPNTYEQVEIQVAFYSSGAAAMLWEGLNDEQNVSQTENVHWWWSLCEHVAKKQRGWGLTGALGHTDGAILVLGIGVGLQFECVLVVDEGLGTQGHARAGVVEVPASL